MTIAFPETVSSSPTTSRKKRSRDEVFSEEDHMMDDTTIELSSQKSARVDFYVQRMEHRLQWALKCARDGNERMMTFYLEQAEKDALHCGSWGHTFVSWKSWIWGQFQQQRQQR